MNIIAHESHYKKILDEILNETLHTTPKTDSKSSEIERRIAHLKLTPYTQESNYSPVSFRTEELYYAIEKRDRVHVQELLKCLNVNDLNSDKYNRGNPLAFAAKMGEPDILLDLVEAGASDVQINKSHGRPGKTALYYASTFGQEESVRILLALGATTSLKGRDENDQELYDLHDTISKGHLKCVKLLVEASPPSYVNESSRGIHTTPLAYAFECNQAEIMEYLLTRGASLSVAFPNRTEEELMHGAAVKGYLDIVKLFVRRGVSIDAKSTYFNQSLTALTTAKILGHYSVVDYLERAGATYDEEIVSYSRSKLAHQTLIAPCELGVFNKKWGFSTVQKCFAELLVQDIDTIVHKEKKWTLLHLVAARPPHPQDNRSELVEQLISHGADKELKDREGKRASDLALAQYERIFRNHRDNQPFPGETVFLLEEAVLSAAQLVIDQLLYEPSKNIRGPMNYHS